MRQKDPSILRSAQLLTARFGFLTQDIFFNHLCDKSLRQKYVYWAMLTEEGWFVRSSQNPQVLYLSSKSRKTLGFDYSPARALQYVEHDSYSIHFYLLLKSMGIVKDSWTDGDLIHSPSDSYEILGTEIISKIPDLILDFKMGSDILRVAIEIENNRKSRNRYAQIALAYLSMKRIDLIIFGCATTAIASEVQRAFRGERFSKTAKTPGLFILEDFKNNRLKSRLTFQNNEFDLLSFLRLVTKNDGLEIPSKQHLNNNAMLFREDKNGRV